MEYRNGRLGVAVSVGDRPHWDRASLDRASLNRGELNQILGNETVKRIARHGRDLGARGALRGQWYQVNRRSAVLEATVGGYPVAEAYDYGGDGYVDRVIFARESVRPRRPR